MKNLLYLLNRPARWVLNIALLLVTAMVALPVASAAPDAISSQDYSAAVNDTFTVNDSGDADDAVTADGLCDVDLTTPGLQCTLRAAIQEANAQPGLDTINFDLPFGSQTIQPASALPDISDAVIIDASTEPGPERSEAAIVEGNKQPAAACLTPTIRLDGALAGPSTDGLTISSGGSTVRSLIITRFAGSGIVLNGGSSNTVVCNLIGTDDIGTAGLGNGGDGIAANGSSNNQIGASNPDEGNVIAGNNGSQILINGVAAAGNQIQSNIVGTDPGGTVDLTGGGGIDIVDAPNNVVGGTAIGAGNHIAGSDFSGVSLTGYGTTGTIVQGNVIGLDSSGVVALPNAFGISLVDATGSLIGGSVAGAGNTISGNYQNGIYLTPNSDSNEIVGNIIGLDISGSVAVGNGYHGIVLEYADGNTIGGSAAGAGNTISGNGSQGVLMVAAQNNTILGNRIGTDITGAILVGNTLNGVFLNSGASNNMIGGEQSGEGNLIAGNGQNGVVVSNPPTWTTDRNQIRGNRIFDNGGLGIDLENDGVTTNDPGDSDAGANTLQNYPTLTAAMRNGTSTTITGTLDTLSNIPVTIDVYYSPSCDPSGYGEGKQVAGSFSGTTDGSGQWTFSETLAASVPAGAIVTATATDGAGNTSEFSACAVVQAPPATCTPGPHSGTISADERWCAADSPHLMTGDVTVAAGVTLTVEPGTVVKGNTTVELNVQGHLAAIGTAALPIIFTSSVDTAYNQWSGIVFAGGTGELDYTTVRYGGRPNSINATCGSSGLGFNIAVRNVLAGEVRIRNSQVRSVGYMCNFHSPDYGLYVDNSRVTVENTTFANNGISNTGDYAIYVAGVNSSLNLTGNTFVDNSHNRVLVASNAMTAADFTFVDEEGLESYELSGDLTVPAGITMTVAPGVMMMGRTDVEVQTLGHLEAVGTPTQPITFTSATNTGGNQWSGLVFEGGTGDLNYVTVRYGGRPNSINATCGSSGTGFNIAARNVLAGEVRIRHSVIRSADYQCNFDSSDFGLYVNNSRVTVEDTLFANNGTGSNGYAIYVTGANSVLNLTGNTFVDNAHDRVLVAPGAMTAADFIWPHEEGLESYELLDDFTVPAGITMTLEPGVMVMARNTATEFNVQGHLAAIGTPSLPITITSAVNSGSNQWAGLVFEGAAGGGTGELDHVTVRYGGRPNSINATCGSSGMGFNIGVRNVLAGEVRIRNSQVRSVAFNCNFDSRDYGLYVSNSRVTVENSLFANNGNSNTTNPSSGDFAVYASGASTVLTFDGNVVRDNRRGLQLNGVGAQILRNNVFKDNPLGGVYIAASTQAQLLHTTFTGNSGDAVTVASGGSAAMTNSIFAANTTGVRVNAGGAATLERTLWDGNGINTVGTVSQTGSISGPALFASDGYHLTRLSLALEQGVDAGIAVDIDGEARPLPAGTGPDLGADEYDAVQELIFEKIALPPVWEVAQAIPGGSLTQRYLLSFRYGSPDQNAAPLDVTVTDTLPAALTAESQTHWPPMSFSQVGQTLTWQTQAPLARGQSGVIDITTRYANPQPGQVLTNTAALNTLAAQAVTQAPLYAPILVTPGAGELCAGAVDIRGLAQPGMTVHLFINGAPLAQIATNAAGEFSATYSYGGSAMETLTAQACMAGGQCSAVTSPVTLRPPQSFWCPQRSSWEGTPTVGPKAGQHLVFGFRNNTGEFSSQNWRIPGVYGFWNTTLNFFACNCPPESGTTAQPSSVWVIADNHRYDPTGSHPNYTFAVTGGAHNVVFWADCGGNYVSSTGKILIDPDGYVFDVTQGFDPNDPTAHAIDGVTVTLYELVPEWGGWTPWPAHLYNSQANPQVTGSDGYFAFFTPPGQYYLQVDGKPGYQSWRSPVITVVNEIVHVNVPYTPWPPPPAIESVTEVLLTANGPQPASITVVAGDTVRWRAEVDGLALPQDLANLAENPVLHPLSALDPISSTLGWDGGMLKPGQTYERQMNQPGPYTYSDGLGNTGQVCVDTCTPLAVTLASFEATAQPGAIHVSWETASEIGNTGFNLYRSLDDDRNHATLLAYVPSQAPGSTQGFAYSYDDTGVAPGQTAWYWLADVDVNGAATEHGPVSATMQTPTAVTLASFDAETGNSTRTVAAWLLLLALLVISRLAIRQRRPESAEIAAKSAVRNGFRND